MEDPGNHRQTRRCRPKMPGTMLTSRAPRTPLLVLLVWFAAILLPVVAACGRAASPGHVTLRVGYFPNITHSQAVIGVADGTFRRALGDEVDLQPRVFNAGPSAMEALFARQIDIAYIGPNPTINGFVRSNGRALRIVGGATSGGAVLVVRADGGIERAAQFEGKRIAS